MYSANSVTHADPPQTGILEEDERDEGTSKCSFMQHGKVLLVQQNTFQLYWNSVLIIKGRFFFFLY